MDETAKQRIRAALVAQATTALEALRQQVAEDDAATRIPGDETHGPDDLSQADEAGDLGALLEQSVAHQAAALDAIKELDFGPTGTVRPGAVVTFDGSSYVVGVVADAFEVDGTVYEGISADSPVAAAIDGLEAGATFSFAGRAHTLDAVG
jgi:hypothetical protein